MDLTFEEFWEDLNNGFEFTYVYLGKKYTLSKLNKNCYSQKMIIEDIEDKEDKGNKGKEGKKTSKKTSRSCVLTLKTLKENFPFFQEIEYTVITQIK